MTSYAAVWLITITATAGVILRPFNQPEAIWAVLGAAILIAFGLLPVEKAVIGVTKGTDVYLFLIGMMLLAEVARQEGLFDWLASHAARFAKGSASRLFFLIYGVGTIVTAFLSNDATAVVLTPAVAAAAKAAKVSEPLPYLLICAFIANAASFVLPISNPANLVIYGSHMPPLLQWLPRFAIPAALSIVITYFTLRWTQRSALKQKMATDIRAPKLSRAGLLAAVGIAATSVTLVAVSSLDIQLGLPTSIAGSTTALVVIISERKAPWGTLMGVSWAVLPLVAGLFVQVEALDHVGSIAALSAFLRQQSLHGTTLTAWGAGAAIAFLSNLINNLPVGLIAGGAAQSAHVSDQITSAILIGVDLGPNLSVTGSLATILWLAALRREGQIVEATAFLKIGFLVMTPALAAALAATIWLK